MKPNQSEEVGDKVKLSMSIIRRPILLELLMQRALHELQNLTHGSFYFTAFKFVFELKFFILAPFFMYLICVCILP